MPEFITFVADGCIIHIPVSMAQTSSQLRWLNQPIFTGYNPELDAPVERGWHLYRRLSQETVYRSFVEWAKDILGGLYFICHYRKPATSMIYKVVHMLPRTVQYHLQSWSCIANAIRDKKIVYRWRVA